MVRTRIQKILVANNKIGSALKFYPFTLWIDSSKLYIKLKSNRSQLFVKFFGYFLIFIQVFHIIFFSLPFLTLRVAEVPTVENVVLLILLAISLSTLILSTLTVLISKSVFYVARHHFTSDILYGMQLH